GLVDRDQQRERRYPDCQPRDRDQAPNRHPAQVGECEPRKVAHRAARDLARNGWADGVERDEARGLPRWQQARAEREPEGERDDQERLPPGEREGARSGDNDGYASTDEAGSKAKRGELGEKRAEDLARRPAQAEE